MNQNQLREYLFQQDLAHQKEMDKLIKDAQPKKINEDYKVKLMRPPIITRDLIGPEYVAERQLLDLSLDLQMQNTIKQAMYALDGKTPEPMKGSVTEEMIADYKKEVMKPVEIGGKYHLYRPVEIPPLIKPKDLPYNHKGPKISEADFNNQAQIIFDDIKKFEEQLERLQTTKKILEDKFILGSSSSVYDEEARRADLEKLSKNELIAILNQKTSVLSETELINKIITKEKLRSSTPATVLGKIKTDLGYVESDIQHFTQQIKNANKAFRNLKTDFDQQADIDEENRLRTIEFDNKKRQLAQDVLSDFNRLNQGKIEVARQPNETDDEFIARLQQMGNIFVDPADMAKQIETEILMKAKKNILELTSDYGKAESVTRMLNNNERFQMNKAFPMIKKEYSETFGLNNRNLDDVEITQFIKNKLETGQALISPAEKVEKQKISTKLRQFKKPQLEAIIDELNRDDPTLGLKKGTIKEMVDELDSKDVYDAPRFRALLRMPDPATETAPIMPVAPATRSSVSSLSVESEPPPLRPDGRPSMAAILAGARKKKSSPAAEALPPPTGRPSMADILAGAPKKKKSSPAAEPEPPKAAPPSLLDAIKSAKLTPGSDRVLRPRVEKPPPPESEIDRKLRLRREAIEPTPTDDPVDKEEWDGDGLSGRGIKNHVLPSTVPFGKIALDLNKLFYQNILSIKRHNGNKIIGHKNKRVSDNFVDIIMKMFENKPITQSDLRNIKDEQMLYDNLIVQSGLHKLKKIPTNIEQTTEQMKNRLGLITGEIEAGNSNKSLLNELHELLFKMVRVHLISKNAAAAYYKNIKDQFFTL